MKYRLRLLAFSLLALCLVSATAQEGPGDKDKVVSKKTTSGFEIFLLNVQATTDRDELNNVPTFRYGSCPPGAVLPDIKLLGNSGNDVVIVRLGIKVLPNYGGGSLSLPVLIDAAGKKYSSRRTMLADSLPELFRTLKGTDKQLHCEFPFETPAATQIKQVQFEEVLFDLKESTVKP